MAAVTIGRESPAFQSIKFGNNGALGVTTGTVEINGGGVLDLYGYSPTVGAVTLVDGSIINNGGTAALTADSYAVMKGTIDAALAGTGALTKTTCGTVTLGGQNTYTGATTVTAGVLELAVPARGPVLTGSGADLQAGKIIFDYTNSGDNPNSTIEEILAIAYGSGFLSGQIRETTAATTGWAFGWKDDGAESGVVVMATPYGDANLDGVVNSTDINLAIVNEGSAGDWSDGDFNYSGTVTSTDVAAAQANNGWDAFLWLHNSDLAHYTRGLAGDGSIVREDMMAILRHVETYGNLGVIDFNDLKTIIDSAAFLNMPNYVAVLAGDVVNGNTANAHYQDSPLGNLAVGSTPAHLETLVSKWFLGTDHPAADTPYDLTQNYGYESIAGLPFGPDDDHVPSYSDVAQGLAATCYFNSALAAIAVANPQAIKNMIQPNGDGTWTVRFYADGVADYVTVDDQLPVDAQGRLVYDGYSWSAQDSSKFIWLPLLEKAYAQWTETGKVTNFGQAGNPARPTENSYHNINGGSSTSVFAQVANVHSVDIKEDVRTGSPLTMESQFAGLNAALATAHAVTVYFNLPSSHDPITGFYQGHYWAVVGYDSEEGTTSYSVYNPYGYSGLYGSIQPPPAVTESQLAFKIGTFTVADVSDSESFD